MNFFCVLGTFVGAVCAGLALNAAVGADNIHDEILQVDCEHMRSNPFSLLHTILLDLFLHCLVYDECYIMNFRLSAFFTFLKYIFFWVLCDEKESYKQQTDLWWAFLPSGLLQLVGLSAWRVSFELIGMTFKGSFGWGGRGYPQKQENRDPRKRLHASRFHHQMLFLLLFSFSFFNFSGRTTLKRRRA